VQGTISSYGEPYRQLVDDLGLSWTAWCASQKWYSRMFDAEYRLLVGQGNMGGFAKDWLYETRDDHPPIPFEQ
jgi:hypothetical protein